MIFNVQKSSHDYETKKNLVCFRSYFLSKLNHIFTVNHTHLTVPHLEPAFSCILRDVVLKWDASDTFDEVEVFEDWRDTADETLEITFR